MNVIVLEAVFAAGALLGTAVGWWAGRSADRAEEVEMLTAATKVLNNIGKG